MDRTPARWAAAAAAMTVLALAGEVPAAADPASAGVYAALGVDQVPGDYVVMVDVSGSMNGARYAEVRRSLTEFLAALAPDDQVTLIPFAERASASTRPAGRSPGALVDTLPAAATGRYTDIGAALEASVHALGRAGAPAVATVVLLTDGRHDPGPRSAYPFTQGYQWNQLARSAARLHKTSIVAFAVPLAGATGAPLLRTVFPAARILEPSAVGRLTADLEQPKATARAAKARSLLAPELNRPLQVTWPAGQLGAGRSTVDVRIHSPMAHVPLTIDGLAVRTGDPNVTATVPPGPYSLLPGRTITVHVEETWDAGPRRAAPLATMTGQNRIELSGRVGSPWSGVLTGELGLSFAPALRGTTRDQTLSAQRGSVVYWAGAAVVFAAVVVALLGWRRHRLAPVLSGSLEIRSGGGTRVSLPLSGRQTRLSADRTGLPGTGVVTAARRSVWAAGIELRITYSLDGSAGGRGSVTCPPGTTVPIGDTTFTWHAGVPAQRRPRPGRSASVVS